MPSAYSTDIKYTIYRYMYLYTLSLMQCGIYHELSDDLQYKTSISKNISIFRTKSEAFGTCRYIIVT